jgi:hypothetical protein
MALSLVVMEPKSVVMIIGYLELSDVHPLVLFYLLMM